MTGQKKKLSMAASAALACTALVTASLGNSGSSGASGTQNAEEKADMTATPPVTPSATISPGGAQPHR